ncbi:MAG: transposase [Bacteroidaceae bacterium]|nr:transposase [Bacteroidaceae bacterium]MBO4841169.1 transposase [Bacteroidaceae bacterium]
MKRETYERQRAFAGELKPSMKRRSLDHDYHSRRIYMITLVVEGRRPLLGHLVGDVNAERGTEAYPHVEPTPLGAAVMDVWNSIPSYHPEVKLIAFQLMPDHIHGILFVTRYLPEGLGKVVLGFKQACNKEYRRLFMNVAVAQQQTGRSQQQTGASQQQPSQQPLDRYHGLLFERGYNDSILLREGQLENMRRYLADNPFRLAMKRARPEFLRVRLDVNICGCSCSAVGNMSLLSAPRKLRVRISRSIDPALLEREKESLLAAAREGAVLVSPAISPGEKAIMRAAFDEGLPLVTLLDNGLDPISKPSGERFRACAEGRLLLLSPFPHRNNHITISRATCEMLNALAWDICKVPS